MCTKRALGVTTQGSGSHPLATYDDDRNATLELAEFAQLVRDLRINTPESVQRRLELRAHAAVVGALDAWWATAMHSMEEGPRST